ncbi:hypothetical protein CF326_g8307 [Tilletia indica]|uniref:Uncharacterized protein n=1 Tax=Tilletia indica TaxID=43049 RepID=A0A8T8SDP9_9BASI|nr:hypothetical protein CF326_g8307 [Tilletia indica]KAE8237459.1 hypothetical protein A4X13_0g8780 [Tilletia indica]
MPADEAERKPLMIKLPRSGKASVKKGQDEEAQELKALGKARKKEMGMETESDTEEDSDDEEEHTIAIQLFAQGDPAATTQRERSPTLLGAQQTAIITTRTTLSEFMDLVAVKAVLELTNSRSEWAIALVISGRSTLYKNPTALDYKTHEGKVVYRNWLSSLKPSRTGTVQVTGVRKPPAAKEKTKAKGAQSEASEGDVKLDTATLKAFTSIIRDNT